jgi:hypothetical protein
MALNESNYQGEIVKWEVERNFSRKVVTVVASAALAIGTVLGIKTKSSVVSTPGANTGNGVMGAITLGALAKAGTYALKCITAAANAGTFQVLDPDGVALPNLTVAVAYAGGHLNMTLADGSADFIVGDTFSIVVSGDGKYYPSVAGAVDGTGDPKAILLDSLAITTGKAVPVLARMAVIEPSKLAWDASYDLDAEKTAALAYLEANCNIVAATGV